MKTKNIQGHKIRFEWRHLTFVLLAALTGFTSVAGATYRLPADRSVTWQGNVGVKDDIPSRTTIYTTLKPSGGDDTSAIQTAINNCPSGQVVKLNAGTFNISKQIVMRSNVVLRGAGMGITIIKGTTTISSQSLINVALGFSLGTSINVTSATKGSSSITTATAHGWSVGDHILIDQLNDASSDPPITNMGSNGAFAYGGRSSGARSLGQIAKVTAITSSTTATLEIPLYWSFSPALAAQATKLNNVIVNTGIEELTVNNSLSYSGSQNGTIQIAYASNCWLYHVDVVGAYLSGVTSKMAYRNTYRGCKVHEGTLPAPSYKSSRAYGIFFNSFGSANLVENNQLYHLWFGVVMAGAISGNVISYNYINELYADTAWNTSAIAFHGAHPVMNLIEGNYSYGRLMADNVWGTSSHNTFFRNKHALLSGKLGGNWNVDLQYRSLYYNVVGNVLGTTGTESSYVLENTTFAPAATTIYRFGYNSEGDSSPSGNDPNVSATVLRHGNWDSNTHGVVWNSSDDRVLPASFYLTGKPIWWGSMQWPAIGPDVSPMNPVAGINGSGTPWDSNKFLSPPMGLKIM